MQVHRPGSMIYMTESLQDIRSIWRNINDWCKVLLLWRQEYWCRLSLLHYSSSAWLGLSHPDKHNLHPDCHDSIITCAHENWNILCFSCEQTTISWLCDVVESNLLTESLDSDRQAVQWFVLNYRLTLYTSCKFKIFW